MYLLGTRLWSKIIKATDVNITAWFNVKSLTELVTFLAIIRNDTYTWGEWAAAVHYSHHRVRLLSVGNITAYDGLLQVFRYAMEKLCSLDDEDLESILLTDLQYIHASYSWLVSYIPTSQHSRSITLDHGPLLKICANS